MNIQQFILPFILGSLFGILLTLLIVKLTRKNSTEKIFDALWLLNMLQEKGRLIDFLMEDIKNYDDSQVGAAVRSIHEECQKIIKEHFKFKSVVNVVEGNEFLVNENFNPNQIKLIGNVGSKPPFKGIVRHSGWYIEEIKFPNRSTTTDKNVIMPAEIEII